MRKRQWLELYGINHPFSDLWPLFHRVHVMLLDSIIYPVAVRVYHRSQISFICTSGFVCLGRISSEHDTFSRNLQTLHSTSQRSPALFSSPVMLSEQLVWTLVLGVVEGIPMPCMKLTQLASLPSLCMYIGWICCDCDNHPIIHIPDIWMEASIQPRDKGDAVFFVMKRVVCTLVFRLLHLSTWCEVRLLVVGTDNTLAPYIHPAY